MGLRPLAVTSCCLLALSAVACEEVLRGRVTRQEEPWKNVLAAEIRLPGTEQAVISHLSQLLARVASFPGVEAVAAVDVIPGITDWRRNQQSTAREGVPSPAVTAGFVQGISPGYFATMGIGLIRGRPFSEGDRESSTPVAIISATYAKLDWPEEDPVGKRLKLPSFSGGPWMTIVGIVQDGPAAEGVPEVYVPYAQYALRGRAAQVHSWFVLARFAGEPEAVAAALKQTLGQEFGTLETWQKKRKPA